MHHPAKDAVTPSEPGDLDAFTRGVELLIERALFYASCIDVPLERLAVAQPGEVEAAAWKQTMATMGVPPGVVQLWGALYTRLPPTPPQEVSLEPTTKPRSPQPEKKKKAQPRARPKSPRTLRREATIAAARRNAVKRHGEMFHSAKDRKSAAELQRRVAARIDG